MKIMNRREARPENLPAFHEVSQVREAVITAGVAAAIRIWRRGVIPVASVPELDFAT